MRYLSLDTLKSKVTAGGGFANPSLYYVRLPTLSLNNEQKKSVEFFVKNIQLPSRSLMTVSREIGLDQTLVPYGYNNPTVSMTFRVMNDQLTRQYIETWQQFITGRYSDEDGHVSVAYPEEYMRRIQIFQLDRGVSLPIINRSREVGLGSLLNINVGASLNIERSGGAVYQWNLEEAYPVSFTQESLSDDAKNSISEISVTFQYRNWTGTSVSTDRVSSIKTEVGIGQDIEQRVGNKISNSIYDFIKRKIKL
tara:strand:- start:6346 stop:7101 length:756 start_codon:yes stop_codon:yes gene_type:complete